MRDLPSKRTVIVTGVATGIGQAFAREHWAVLDNLGMLKQLGAIAA